MLTIHPDSHLDHAVTDAQRAWLMEKYKDRDGFFIETVSLPPELGGIPCALHGPLMGDPPVPESEVVYQARGARSYLSRTVPRPLRQVQQVTIIAGPHDGLACVLYTIFGGPQTVQEPADPTCKDVPASQAFWAEHALTAS